MKKKFKETVVGKFLIAKAPNVIDMIGDVFPPVSILSKLVSKEADLSVEDSDTFMDHLEAYEVELSYHLENTKGARGIYGASKDITDSLGSKIMNMNLPIIILLVIINIVCIKYLDSGLLAIASNGIGMVMQKLFEERSTVTNFYFGSSKGSKDKEKLNINS